MPASIDGGHGAAASRAGGTGPRREASWRVARRRTAASGTDPDSASVLLGFLSDIESSESVYRGFGHLANAAESLGFGAIVYTAIPLTLGTSERPSPAFLASGSDGVGLLAKFVARRRGIADIARPGHGIRGALSIPTRSDRHVIAGASVIRDERTDGAGPREAQRLETLKGVVRAFHRRAFEVPAMRRHFYSDFLDRLTADEAKVIGLVIRGGKLKSSLELCGMSPTRAGNLLSSLYRRLGIGNGNELAYLVGVHRVDQFL